LHDENRPALQQAADLRRGAKAEGTVRTFKELADAALGQEPTHMVVKELAQAMDRLEYNLAVQLIDNKSKSVIDLLSRGVLKALVQGQLESLRAEKHPRYDDEDNEQPSMEAARIAARLLERYEMKPRT
jgi:hypothetical protein